MLENIRKIGLFMIAAQAVIHFAPGKQYEKYIKLISSVIVLFLFVRPFITMQGDLEGEWRTGLDQITEKFGEEDVWQERGQSANDMALEQFEEEVKSRLNESIPEEAYCVKSVSFVLEGDSFGGEDMGYDPHLQKVEIVMAKKGGEEVEPILVEDIVIGEGREEDTKEAFGYQENFAKILGIEPDRVEVICAGGW